jgi:hypothetical protein
MNERKTTITLTATEVSAVYSALALWEDELAQNDEMPMSEAKFQKLMGKVSKARDRAGRVILFTTRDYRD